MRFRTGKKIDVLLRMVECAIRDQAAFISVYTPKFGPPDEDAQKEIDNARNLIADFRAIAASLKKQRHFHTPR